MWTAAEWATYSPRPLLGGRPPKELRPSIFMEMWPARVSQEHEPTCVRSCVMVWHMLFGPVPSDFGE